MSVSIIDNVNLLKEIVHSDKLFLKLYKVLVMDLSAAEPLFNMIRLESVPVIRRRFEEIKIPKDEVRKNLEGNAYDALTRLAMDFSLLCKLDKNDYNCLIRTLSEYGTRISNPNGFQGLSDADTKKHVILNKEITNILTQQPWLLILVLLNLTYIKP